MATIVIILCVWLVPVLLIGQMAHHWLRKDRKKVIIVGLIFSSLGAAIAAAILPKLSEEEWEEINTINQETSDNWNTYLGLAVVMCVLAILGIIMIASI